MSDALFDLGAVSDVLAAHVPLRHPISGAELGATLELAGPEHPARRAAVFERQRRLRAQMLKSGKLDLSGQDPQDEEDAETDLLAASVLGWRGLARNGQPLLYSAAAARELLTAPGTRWVRAQVREALERRELFIASSATV